MKRIFRSLGPIALGWLIGSCGGAGDVAGPPPPPPPPTTATVTVAAPSGTLVPAVTVQLVATAKAASGEQLQRSFSWSSSDLAKATVSTAGVLTAVAPGQTTITATVDGKTGSLVVTVLDGGVVSSTGSTLNLESGIVQIVVPADAVTGATPLSVVPSTAFGADARVVKGTPFDFGPPGAVFAKPVDLKIKYDPANLAPGTEESALELYLSTSTGWQVVAGSIADTAANVVSAPVSHFSTYAILTPEVVAAISIAGTPVPIIGNAASLVVGASNQLTATLTAADGRVLTNRAVNWSTSDQTIAAIASNGMLTALGPGVATASASASGQTASVTITVTPVPVAAVTVTLLPSSITAVETSQATALTLASNGETLTGRAITWTSDNTGVATVGSAGVVTAVSVGNATITAVSEGKSGSASLTVTPAAVASVTVDPVSATVTVGNTEALSVTLRDAHNNVLTGRVVSWTSSATSIATVSSTGLVTALAPGSATITATSEAKTASASITVTTVPVASVTVALAATSINAVETTQATATTLDGSGGVLTGRTINWTSSNTSVATVSSGGLVTAVSAGTANITATSEGKSGSATLTVTPASVATITVSPTSASVIAGSTQQFTATLKDAHDNVLTGRVVSWSSDATSIATVSSTGLVTAVAAGNATITATSEGQSATSSITVTPVPVASVTVTLADSSINAVESVQATASTLDGSGGVLTGRAIAWSSSSTAVATVSSTGLVTAVAVGTANITATSEGKSGSATLTVTQAPVATVSVTLAASSITAVGTTQATATLKDAQDRVLTGRPVAWSSDNTGVATVSSSGLVTAVSAGTANITATSESQSGSAALTVTQAPVATVTVSPAAPGIVAGNTQQLTATLKDAQNRVLTGRTVTWLSDNTGVAKVSSTGLVTAVAAGGATITATSEAVNGTSAVTVTAAPPTGTSLLRRSTQNPRYFENASGQIVYLTGSHTWSNLQDNGTTDPPAAFNYTAYLDFLESHNHNFFRLWAWEQANWTAEITGNYRISPGPYQRTGSGTALDGKPKFDLTQFNQAYFDRLRQRVIDAGARGIYVSVMLFEGWSVGTKGGFADDNPWKGHPFNTANNINSVNGDTNGDGQGFESHTLANNAVTVLQDAYVRKVIDAVGDLDNVLYEISNESDASSMEWQYHMIQLIRDYESTRPKQHPVGMTAMWPGGSDADLTGSTADWISASGTVAGSINFPATATGTKVLITDTDHVCGICGDMAWVWKSFTKGHNPILMDGYDAAAIGMGAADYDPNEARWEEIRRSMGYTRSYALRMDLTAAVPHGDLVDSETTGYALVKPGSQYLVFVPGGGSVTVNFSAVAGSLNIEWFNPATGVATQSGTVLGGASRTLTSPFSGPAVLFVY